MSRHGGRVLPEDQQPTDVIPAVPRAEVTAAMPVVDEGWFRPGPGSHRRERDGWVSGQVLTGLLAGLVGVGLAAAAVLVSQSQGGGTVRESVLPSAAPVSSEPHVVISAPTPPHTPRPVDRVRTRRPFVPVLPAPTHSRPRVTPRASVKPSLTPSHSKPPTTPPLTCTTPDGPSPSPGTPTTIEETPCPA